MRTPYGQIAETPKDDTAFHAPILGDDWLPTHLLDRLRAQASELGIDPALIGPVVPPPPKKK